MSSEPQRVRVEAPADWEPIQIAQAIVGPTQLLKAEYVKTRTWRLSRAMEELQELEVLAYKSMLRKLWDVVFAYVEKEIVLGPLDKAVTDNPQQFITHEQLERIKQLIGDYHEAFVGGMINFELLSAQEITRLQDAGIIAQDLHYLWHPGPHELPPKTRTTLQSAYNYGQSLAMAAPGARASVGKLKLGEFDKLPKPRMTRAEKEAVKFVEQHGAEYVRGLGNRISAATGSLITDAALEAEHRQTIKDEVARNVKNRESWRQIKTEIGDKTKDWARDYGRIAATEKQRAMQQGQAKALIEKHGDPEDIRVAKSPAPDACPHCVRLHFTAGQGSPLRIFKLSELIANGSNVGRKAAAWKATVSPVHPWCACELIHIPEGWAFDDDGILVPEALTRSELVERNLRKAHTLTHNDHREGITVRIADPELREAVELVVAETPTQIFGEKTGVTLITTDHPRAQNPLKGNDLGYWTGNEIRLMHGIALDKVDNCIRHEISHSLNVYLMDQWGSADKVRAWHDKLFKVSKEEGFVSDYAEREPIENAAEATKIYLYEKKRMMVRWPRQFAMLHDAYKGLLR